MAGNPERVRAFYADLVPPLEAAARREIDALRRMAAADGVPPPLQPWDWLYYDARQSRDELRRRQTGGQPSTCRSIE